MIFCIFPPKRELHTPVLLMGCLRLIFLQHAAEKLTTKCCVPILRVISGCTPVLHVFILYCTCTVSHQALHLPTFDSGAISQLSPLQRTYWVNHLLSPPCFLRNLDQALEPRNSKPSLKTELRVFFIRITIHTSYFHFYTFAFRANSFAGYRQNPQLLPSACTALDGEIPTSFGKPASIPRGAFPSASDIPERGYR